MHNHTYRIFYRVLRQMFQKRGTPKAFLRHNLWCTAVSEKEMYGVVFPGFKYKPDSFNLYIIDNYVKRTTGRCIPRIE